MSTQQPLRDNAINSPTGGSKCNRYVPFVLDADPWHLETRMTFLVPNIFMLLKKTLGE